MISARISKNIEQICRRSRVFRSIDFVVLPHRRLRVWAVILTLLVSMLTTVSCSKNTVGISSDKMTVSGREEGVAAFQALQKDYVSSYDNDTCFNITPDYVQNNSGYRIFKYSQSCATFLLYEGSIYPLGGYFGGFGVVSLAMADLNADGLPELYFTSSWGSGLHRSNAAYFEPATREIIAFSYTHLNEDMMFAYNPAGGLSLHEAAITGISDFAHFSMEKKDFLADVVVQEGKMDIQQE